MLNVVFDEPYEFVPPVHSDLWPFVLKHYLPRYLRTRWGVASIECRGAERLRQSLEAGHGILLAPNHSRLSDPLVLGILAVRSGSYLYAMASWHLFMQGRLSRFMIRRMGAFSLYREGLDKAAIATAVDILEHARRPLIVFPEGAVSRHNDVLMPLMDGISLITHSAAKRRARHDRGAGIVVHPVAIRYFFQGDLQASLSPVLSAIESRLSWRPREAESLADRLLQIGHALLALKELEYFGSPQQGGIHDRIAALIERLLAPLEKRWDIKTTAESVVIRVKNLRAAILPDLVTGCLSPAERDARWQQLRDCYLAQQLYMYPRDYVTRSGNVAEHLMETAERFEEDMTDTVTSHRPFRVVVHVGTAIEVPAQRDRHAESDPIMSGIEKQLRTMLAGLAQAATRVE